MNQLISLTTAGLVLSSAVIVSAASPKLHKKQPFTIEGADFKIDGKPIIILSGELHYTRTPKAYWRDRLKKARAMGLNTICTYTFWNRHEPSPGKWNFEGDDDLVAFVKMCQEEDLFVIVRPGPYVCTEWDCGGIPGWTLADPNAKIRDNNPGYMKPAMEYVAKISSLMEPLSVNNGGPVLMIQVENEYGSFGHDKAYLQAHVDAIRKGGWKGELFTSDGPTDRMIKNGTLPGVTATMNYAGNSKNAWAKHAQYRKGEARMVGEFWVGWFDQWLKPHNVRAAAPAAREFDWMLSEGISVNIYMFHGGTNFGYWAGANGDANHYDSDTTSYDYSAVLSEAGHPTDKFFAFQKVIKKNVPSATFGPMSAPIPVIDLPEIQLTETAHLFNELPESKESENPLKMEQLGQSLGFVLYETYVKGNKEVTLSLDALQDRAQVYLDDQYVGILDRRSKKLSIHLKLTGGDQQLRILVENMGRVNFGRGMLNERKGIHGVVKIDGKPLTGWKNYSLPLSSPDEITFTSGQSTLPIFKKGFFEVKSFGDAWLDMAAWGKGVVWVNGHNLGRYWSRGPQQTLYIPGCWLNEGENEVVVLELENSNTPEILKSSPNPIWEVRADDSLLIRKKGQNLDISGEKPIHKASFTSSDTWQEIKFSQPQKGRYLAIECLNAIDGGPYAAIAELEILDAEGDNAQGDMISREKIAVVYADSEELVGEGGGAHNVIDNQPTTWWHTEWKGKSPKYPHVIVLDLGKVRKISGFRYLPRPDRVNGRVKDYEVFLKDSKFKGL